MTQKLGSDLVTGDIIYERRIARVEKATIPACVLHSYYRERFPNGMPGAYVHFAHEKDKASAMTVFDDDFYEVT